MRTSPFLEQGTFENQTAYIGQNTSIPCFELISGTLPDFRWLKWKDNNTPNLTTLDHFIYEKHLDEDDLNVKILSAKRYRQIVKTTNRRSQYSNPLLHGVQLTLSNVTAEDHGWYTCLVSNHIGGDYVSMYLDVKEKGGMLFSGHSFYKLTPS